MNVQITKATGDKLELPLPFFWFDPSWHFAPIERGRQAATAASGVGIVVSALHSDLNGHGESDRFQLTPRLAPHHSDRAGWTYGDFEDAAIIELRVSPLRDEYGRFAYHPAQWTRWKQYTVNDADAVESSVLAMNFPPDWKSLDDMASKVEQLRRLSSAAIFVSYDAFYFATLIPAALAAGVDGLIASVLGDPLYVINQSRLLLDNNPHRPRPALWIATDQRLTAEDCVKCLALGATGLSLDAYCNELFGNQRQAQTAIAEWLDEVQGHANSCGVAQIAELNRQHLRPMA